MSVPFRRRAGWGPQLGGHGTGIWPGAGQASGGSRAQGIWGGSNLQDRERPTKEGLTCIKMLVLRMKTKVPSHDAAMQAAAEMTIPSSLRAVVLW